MRARRRGAACVALPGGVRRREVRWPLLACLLVSASGQLFRNSVPMMEPPTTTTVGTTSTEEATTTTPAPTTTAPPTTAAPPRATNPPPAAPSPPEAAQQEVGASSEAAPATPAAAPPPPKQRAGVQGSWSFNADDPAEISFADALLNSVASRAGPGSPAPPVPAAAPRAAPPAVSRAVPTPAPRAAPRAAEEPRQGTPDPALAVDAAMAEAMQLSARSSATPVAPVAGPAVPAPPAPSAPAPSDVLPPSPSEPHPFVAPVPPQGLLVAPRAQSSDSGGSFGLVEFFQLLGMPLEIVQDLAVTIVIVVALMIMYKNQEKVIFLITGDDRIHGTGSDFIWWACCRCCGRCSHDWTRCFTRWPCCPRSIQGSNLVKLAGAYTGVATHTVEISNLVVGDLPFLTEGDFYLSFECSQNPPIMTSIIESKPKVIHFPEVITLRIRDSHLEPAVKIKVLELNVIGSNELCELTLAPSNIVDWARDNRMGMIKRFAMHPRNKNLQVPTPPWIAMEFDFPRNDLRDLDHLHATGDYVRTATWGTDGASGSTWQDHKMSTFKRDYVLVDSTGHAVREPREEDIAFLRVLRGCVLWMVSCLSLLLSLLVFLVMGAGMYLGACFRSYTLLNMALHNVVGKLDLPVSTVELIQIESFCKAKMEGTGVAPGGDPCRPSDEQVLETCHGLPTQQPVPTAFAISLHGAFPWDLDFLTCPAVSCDYFLTVSAWDRWIIGGCVVVMVLTCFCLRPCANQAVERYRTRLVAHRNQQHQESMPNP